MKKILGLGIIVVSLVGCATTPMNYQPQHTNISTPPLNAVATAYVGDSLLEQGRVAQADGIKLESRHVLDKAKMALTAGTYIKIGENEKQEFYLPHKGNDSGKLEKTSVLLSFDPAFLQSIVVNKETGTVSLISSNVQSFDGDVVQFSKVKITVKDTNSFQQTLIYNGKVGNKINIGYREFSGDVARPAFSNSVEYDLNESKVIGYKGAQLEILSADNQSIKYKVLQNFNQATQ